MCVCVSDRERERERINFVVHEVQWEGGGGWRRSVVTGGRLEVGNRKGTLLRDMRGQVLVDMRLAIFDQSFYYSEKVQVCRGTPA